MLFEKINHADYKYILEICEKYKYYSDMLFEKVKDIYEFIDETAKSNYRKIILQGNDNNVQKNDIKIVSQFKKIVTLHNLLKSNDIKVKKIYQKIKELYYECKYIFDKVGLLVPENANNLYFNKEKIEETINVLEMLISDNKRNKK